MFTISQYRQEMNRRQRLAAERRQWIASLMKAKRTAEVDAAIERALAAHREHEAHCGRSERHFSCEFCHAESATACD